MKISFNPGSSPSCSIPLFFIFPLPLPASPLLTAFHYHQQFPPYQQFLQVISFLLAVAFFQSFPPSSNSLSSSNFLPSSVFLLYIKCIIYSNFPPISNSSPPAIALLSGISFFPDMSSIQHIFYSSAFPQMLFYNLALGFQWEPKII